MTAGLKTIIYPVKDIAPAKALFSALLEVEPYADEPYYVGFKDAGQDVGLDPNGHAKGMTGPVPYWHVSDIRGRLAALVDAGAEMLQDVAGRRWRQADRLRQGRGRQPRRTDPGSLR